MRSLRTLSAALCLALVAPGASEGQTLPVEPRVLQPGDTVRETLFAFTRPQAEALKNTLDSLRVQVRQLKKDTTNLREQRDSLDSALSQCHIKVDAREIVLEAEREARKALQDAQPSGLERLLQGPSGVAIGGLGGLTAGVLACRGAN